MITINTEKYNKIYQEASEIYSVIKNIEENLEVEKQKITEKEKEFKALLPKGYWWTYDIDTRWKQPKKYSIKKVEFTSHGLCLTIKEVCKKLPWVGYKCESEYSLKEFLKINIYKTEEDAKTAYYNRICPKCGGIMKYSSMLWCAECVKERHNIEEEFNKNKTFYNPDEDNVYEVRYSDELTSYHEKGYGGKHFIIQRLDTGEIINTDNLWSCGTKNYDINSIPKIKFLNE